MRGRTAVSVSLSLTLLACPFLVPPVHAALFTRIVAPLDPFPDSGDTVRQIGEPVFDEAGGGNQFLVLLDAGLERGSFQALYRVDAANQFQRVVATSTGPDALIHSFGHYTLYESTVYFLAFDEPFHRYLCKVTEPGGPVTVIAAKGDLIAGLDRFEGFDGGLSAYAGGLVFGALVNRDNGFRTYHDVFHHDGSALTSLVGFGTMPVPGSDFRMFFVGDNAFPIVRGGEVAFLGGGQGVGFPPVTGLYALPLPGAGGTPRVIVNDTDNAPGSTGVLITLGRSIIGQPLFDFASGEAAFYATSFDDADAGFYRHTAAGGLVTVANRDTVVPGGTLKFAASSFAQGQVSLSGGRMVFHAGDDLFRGGIYVHNEGVLEKLIAAGEEVGGAALHSFTVHRHGLAGDQVVFTGNNALYRAALNGGSTPAPVSLVITRTGDAVSISWDADAAGPGAELQSTPSLSTPDWREVIDQANPFIVAPSSTSERYFRLQL